MKRIWLFLLIPIAVLSLSVWLLKYIWAFFFNTEYAKNLLVSIDQLANTALNGDMDETISSRAGRAVRDKDKRNTWWACPLCFLLNKLQKNHCKNSIGV